MTISKEKARSDEAREVVNLVKPTVGAGGVEVCSCLSHHMGGCRCSNQKLGGGCSCLSGVKSY